MPAKDLRTDLKERLADAQKRRAETEKLLSSIEDEIEAIERFIEIEDRRFGITKTQPPEPDMDLPAFIKKVAKDKPLTKGEIADLAKPHGYFREDVSPGRVVHFTIVNMLGRGDLKEVKDGKYLAS